MENFNFRPKGMQKIDGIGNVFHVPEWIPVNPRKDGLSTKFKCSECGYTYKYKLGDRREKCHLTICSACGVKIRSYDDE